MKTIQKNWLEWVVFGVSISLLLATVAMLSWKAIITDDRPPLLSIDSLAPVREGDALRVSVTVKNAGDQAAQQVDIEVQIVGGDGEERTGNFQLDQIPGGSSATGELIFFGAPAGEVRAEGLVAGYNLP
jgi:uncharacterized protein (TIGR02588 family)